MSALSITPYAAQPATFPLESVNADAGASQALNPPASGGQDVDKASQDFEAVFITQMLSSMFSGDELTQYFGGGSTGEIYKSFLLNEYGKSIAKAGGIGIAAPVKKELLRLQEVAA